MTVSEADELLAGRESDECEPSMFDQAAFLELKAGVDGELEAVADELRHSYVMLSHGLEKLQAEKAAALEDGDEMCYQAAEIKISLVLGRLRELEAMRLS
ncbi:MAG: hypothetical protein JW781_01410 [Deltaproteobacteria bacterium]|nr:hypothetical protein [Candidatus Anaeroferrophillacea bacterium]